MKKPILVLSLTAVCGTLYAQSGANAKGAQEENPVLIAQQRSRAISKIKLITYPALSMPAANNDYHIISYRISYLPLENGNHLLGPFFIQGDKIDKGNAATILSKAKPGDKIFFEDIIAESNAAGKHPLKMSAMVNIQ